LKATGPLAVQGVSRFRLETGSRTARVPVECKKGDEIRICRNEHSPFIPRPEEDRFVIRRLHSVIANVDRPVSALTQPIRDNG
jgi:hypothetical protein